MPTIRIEGYKFRFFSLDEAEPPHVHVVRAEKVSKIWLVPVQVEYNRGYNTPELNKIVRLTRKHERGCSMPGTNTLVNKGRENVTVTSVYFRDDKVVLVLSDEREIALPMKHIKRLAWLCNASEKQRAQWSIEPHGYAVYWDKLDDGIEVAHALSGYRMDTVGVPAPKITSRRNRNGQHNGILGHTAVSSTGNSRRVRALPSKP